MTPKTQDAPGETGHDLNDPQPDIPDEPGRALGYAIYHPDHGFAETCSSSIEDFTDNQNAGMAILLYRQRDVAAADRLQRGWSDEATIIAVPIPGPGQETVGSTLYALYDEDEGYEHFETGEPIEVDVRMFHTSYDNALVHRRVTGTAWHNAKIVPFAVSQLPVGTQGARRGAPSAQPEVGTVPAQLYAIRSQSSGQFCANEINDEPKVYQVYCFASYDEAATARLIYHSPDDEIVPLVPAEAMPVQMAQENRRLRQQVARMERRIQEWNEGEDGIPEDLEDLPSEETLDASAAIVVAMQDELSWLDDRDVIDPDKGVKVVAPLRDFFKLLDSFDGSCRIRKSRETDDEPKRRLIIEDGGGYNVLPARASDQVIGAMVRLKLCEFDAAGVLHVADKGRALIGAK